MALGSYPEATTAPPPSIRSTPIKSPIAHKPERAHALAIRPAARTSGASPTKMSNCRFTIPLSGWKPARDFLRWPDDLHFKTGFVSPNRQTAPEPRTSQTLRQPFRSKRRKPLSRNRRFARGVTSSGGSGAPQADDGLMLIRKVAIGGVATAGPAGLIRWRNGPPRGFGFAAWWSSPRMMV